jgi:hypothetical protein
MTDNEPPEGTPVARGRARARLTYRPAGAGARLAIVTAVVGVTAISFAAWSQQGSAPAPARAPAASVPPPPPPAAAGGQGGAGGEDSPKVKVERGAGGKKVYRITEEIRIEGKIQKPEAFFFYQKSSINYDWQELKQDFVPRILESVSRSPF